MNPIWFKKANFPQYCVKMLVNPQRIACAFSLSYKKFALFKLCDLYIRKIFVFLVRKGEARLSPCKTDKPKKRKFNNIEAYCVQVPCAYIQRRASRKKFPVRLKLWKRLSCFRPIRINRIPISPFLRTENILKRYANPLFSFLYSRK